MSGRAPALQALKASKSVDQSSASTKSLPSFKFGP
jgi:hypothetical protein